MATGPGQPASVQEAEPSLRLVESERAPEHPGGRSGEAGGESAAPLSRTPQRWLLPLLLLLLASGAVGWCVSRWGLEETDNAQLEADLTEISSRVPGTVVRVAVADNQQIAAARREAVAQSALAESTASRAAAAGSEAQAAQEVAAAELQRARLDLRRIRSLVQDGGVSQQEADRAAATFARAQAAFLSSRASRQGADASLSQVGVDREKAAAAAAKVKQAEAALARVQLGLSYLRITAPSAGRIGARTAEPGRQVQPGQPLMTLVSTTPWVEAHFKETQLDALYPGQPAEVRIDAFPGRRFSGRIVSLAPASGARFALLPPDNATGNFTKVVQRITARITLDGAPHGGLDAELRRRLVPGLSASVSVRRR